MKATLAVVVSSLIVVLSGCLASDIEVDSAEALAKAGYVPAVRYTMPEDPMPEGAGHDHSDAAQHQFLWNYEFASHDPLMANDVNVAGLHALDLAGGHLFGAVYGSHAASVDGGLVIWSLEDAANPKEVGRWTVPGSVGGDRSLGVTPDGAFAVLAMETITCFGHVNPSGQVKAHLIDTRDKTRPVVVDAVTPTGQTLGSLSRMPKTPAAGGIHSVEVANIGGTDYAFLFGEVYRIDRSESGARLVYLTTIPVGHDLYVRHTPWGGTWGLVAGGGGTLQLWDLADPAKPLELGVWQVPARRGLEGSRYLHTADVAFFPEKTIIVLTSEDWEDHVSPLWILDATDPTSLRPIGSWGNPGNHTAVGIHFSQHNPRITHGGILSLSHYHGGIIQLDLRNPDYWARPAEMAYATFAEGTVPMMRDPVERLIETGYCKLDETSALSGNDAPLTMDVEVGEDGTLYAADITNGLYAFTPAATHPVFGAAAAAPAN